MAGLDPKRVRNIRFESLFCEDDDGERTFTGPNAAAEASRHKPKGPATWWYTTKTGTKRAVPLSGAGNPATDGGEVQPWQIAFEFTALQRHTMIDAQRTASRMQSEAMQQVAALFKPVLEALTSVNANLSARLEILESKAAERDLADPAESKGDTVADELAKMVIQQGLAGQSPEPNGAGKPARTKGKA